MKIELRNNCGIEVNQNPEQATRILINLENENNDKFHIIVVNDSLQVARTSCTNKTIKIEVASFNRLIIS